MALQCADFEDCEIPIETGVTLDISRVISKIDSMNLMCREVAYVRGLLENIQILNEDQDDETMCELPNISHIEDLVGFLPGSG